MKGYTEITTQEEMDKLLDHIGGFHDSMTKELHIINRGYVATDHSMVMSHQLDGRLLVQSQREPFGLELLFEEITHLEVAESSEYFSGSGAVQSVNTPVECQQVKMKFDSSLSITAARLYYRERREWLGRQSFFGIEVPSSEMVKAEVVEASWRQCSRCGDAWREDSACQYSYCPKCGSLTELELLEE